MPIKVSDKKGEKLNIRSKVKPGNERVKLKEMLKRNLKNIRSSAYSPTNHRQRLNALLHETVGARQARLEEAEGAHGLPHEPLAS